MPKPLPRYPVYIPSKSRYDTALTMDFLEADGVPFTIVVEPPDEPLYRARFDTYQHVSILVTPFQNLGQGAVPVRNFIRDHATAAGHAFHWQLDDNMRQVRRRALGGRRIRCDSTIALRVAEDFTDRYENIALTGIDYCMFLPAGQILRPFNTNVRIYSCWLFRNDLPYRWRGRYNDDTDMTLQVLSGGWCTVLIHAFCVEKLQTMQLSGGMTNTYTGDGRLKMARSLERVWPGVVETRRRFQRPQHAVKDCWKRFDTPLKLKPGIDLSALPRIDEYGMKLTEHEPIKAASLQAALDQERCGCD
jgi:hypothetical protein